ncbi:MAG: hypothetical protein S4CHLAM6_16030 [Chlamydiae bacterium]|nr:hypothetical protein [Chlamydiota bacterium]
MSKKPKLKIRIMSKVYRLCKKYNFPKRHFSQPDFSRILIVSNTGIGDTMWGTPALNVLHKKYPKSHIAVLASPLSEQVLKANPHVNEIITMKRRGGLPYFARFFSFYRKKFDTIILFHSSYKWATPFSYFLGPNRLIGFKHDAKNFDFLLTDLLDAKLNHPIVQRLMLVKRIGVQDELYQMKLYLSKKEEQQADDFLASFNLDPKKPLIGLQPGASEIFKCWPLGHFASLAKKIDQQLGAQIIVFGNSSEMAYAQEIEKTAPVIAAAGQLPLRVSAALLKRLSVFVTNDTGPLHLALAFKVPLVTIFGPTPDHLCWPHLESPIVKILSNPSPCITCVGRKCHLPFCMEEIKVDDVFAHVVKLLNPKKQEQKSKLLTI